MIDFTFESVKPNIYRLIIKEDGKILDVLERQDPRGEMTAKVGLFSFVHARRLDFNNPNIDRLLFL